MTIEITRKAAIEEYGRIFSDEEKSKEPQVNPNTDAVIVLSGHGLYDSNGEPITWVSPENIVRIGFGIDVLKKILSIRLNKGEISNKDILNSNLFLFLNGEGNNQENIFRTQIDDMKRIALSYNFPSEKIFIQDCVINGQANTKTQFEAINNDSRLHEAKHLTLITSDYHAPRVEMTANKQLRSGFEFNVLPAPQLSFDRYNVFERLTGELNRIVNYSKSGDISSVRRK